jgi:hypothetical protein
MTKQDFIEYLSHPENLNGHSMADLEKLVKEYPYFQTGRMLYLKNLHNENSIDYEKNLHVTSAYAPSGKVLYNLIRRKKEDRRQMTEAEQPIPEISIIRHISPSGRRASSVIEVLPKEEAIVILQEMNMNAAKASTDLIPDKAVELSKTTVEDEYDELQLLEKEMLREAYRTSMTIDLLSEQEVKGQEPKTSQLPITSSKKQEVYSFNEWLKVVNGQTPGSAAPEKVVQKKQQTDLIDKFILEETSKAIIKPKVEFYSAETMAKKSITDNESFVSETLASIYLKQGNLPKALRAYEILMVKHPEKIHIFAPLLEKIKKLLKDQKSK